MFSGKEQTFLRDIKEAVPRIQSYTTDMDYELIQTDLKTQDAVLRNLEIIGEATNQLSEEVCEQTPDIPRALLA